MLIKTTQYPVRGHRRYISLPLPAPYRGMEFHGSEPQNGETMITAAPSEAEQPFRTRLTDVKLYERAGVEEIKRQPLAPLAQNCRRQTIAANFDGFKFGI